MIFAHPAGLSSLTASERREALGPGDIAIFPLAFPVIAGPAGLTAVVLLMGQAHGDPLGSMIVLGAMLLCLLLTYISIIFTDVLHSLLKATGSNVLARLAGVILAALAVQFIASGNRLMPGSCYERPTFRQLLSSSGVSTSGSNPIICRNWPTE
jgi:multiple antibiotic resistance protein